MLRRYSRAVAAIVLCFFTWTSAGGFSVAHAAVDGVKKAKAQEQQGKRNDVPQERFSQLTEELAEVLGNPKATADEKKQRLMAAKVEIQGLDTEIRKEFAATEQKLRDAKLPTEILDRHHRFVKHYNDNLALFKGNVERVEKAKTKVDTEVELQETLSHLEKVKAPSKHQPLDPNKLPFDQRKPQKREPRMKQEEFERDLKKDKNAWKQEKRILVASTGSMAGVIGPDELAETIEVQLTPEIRAKALELGNSPHRIYEWVRNNIEFVPTWGSIQGANMTLQTRQGNAFDISSLLVALLRAAGVPSRYVTGTIELPIEKVMNWGGGFTDPMAALDFFSSGGVPTKGLVAGGKVVAARMEHVWVEAFVDYIPSRGAKHRQGEGDTWVKMDAAYKQHGFTPGIDLRTEVPFDAEDFLAQMRVGATINETAGYVTKVNSLLVQQSMQDYQTRVQNYIQQNYPDATVNDVLGERPIVKQELPYLLGTLPYRTAVKGATFSSIPNALRHKLSFAVEREATTDLSSYDPEAPAPVDNTLRMTKSLAELAGKKITLSYSPATSADEVALQSYLPKAHADGSPTQPSELPSSLPAYLINLKPELRVDGQVVATGEPVGLGGTNIFKMTFSDPAYGGSEVMNYIDAGVYQAIGLNLGVVSQDQLTALKAKLEATKAKLQGGDLSTITKDDLMGDILTTTALIYHAQLGALNSITSKAMNVQAMTLPSETIFATKLKVLTMWGIPRLVQAGGLNMDADYLMQVVKAQDGSTDRVRQYMVSSGMTSSALEHSVPEQMFSTSQGSVEAISTVKALKIANDQGMPIYTINQQNLATTLPQLQVGSQVRSEIINAVNAGKMVTVSQANINSGGWNGCGYIISDTETGAGAYMISGGTSGSMVNLGKDLLWGTFTLLGVLLALSGLGVAALLVAVFTNFLISILDSLINKTDFNFGKTLFSTLLGMGGTTLLGALVSGSLYMSLGAIALTPFGFGIIAAGILLVVLMTVGQMLINIAAREESERGRLV